MIDWLITWCAVGWLNVAYACGYRVRYLTSCQLVGMILFLPLVEASVYLIIVGGIVWAITDTWQFLAAAAVAFGVPTAIIASMVIFAILLTSLIDKLKDHCRIIWRKQP